MNDDAIVTTTQPNSPETSDNSIDLFNPLFFCGGFNNSLFNEINIKQGWNVIQHDANSTNIIFDYWVYDENTQMYCNDTLLVFIKNKDELLIFSTENIKIKFIITSPEISSFVNEVNLFSGNNIINHNLRSTDISIHYYILDESSSGGFKESGGFNDNIKVYIQNENQISLVTTEDIKIKLIITTRR